jgi:hypothetical protein
MLVLVLMLGKETQLEDVHREDVQDASCLHIGRVILDLFHIHVRKLI